jgi:uncharacterized protein DUF3237
MNTLKSELLYEAHFDLVPPQVIETPSGTRQIFLVTDGWIKSPKFTVKEMMPGAGDWLRVRNDGVMELDVRAAFRLDDDSLAYISYGGISVVSEAVFGRFLAGEEVAYEEYYFRVTPRFQTGSEKYNWLNNIICVANGKIGPGLQWVEYTAFQIC